MLRTVKVATSAICGQPGDDKQSRPDGVHDAETHPLELNLVEFAGALAERYTEIGELVPRQAKGTGLHLCDGVVHVFPGYENPDAP